jgi:lysyl-tRNA synthetase class II
LKWNRWQNKANLIRAWWSDSSLLSRVRAAEAYTELNGPIEQPSDSENSKLSAIAVTMKRNSWTWIMSALECYTATAGWGMGIDRFVAILTNHTRYVK